MAVSQSVDHANPYTNQIFQEAVSRNDIAVVKLLLKYGINPKRNERNVHGLTALQQSILDGNSRMAMLLLEAGADIEAKTSNGWTCLHIASAIGDLDVLLMLINHCADLIAVTKNEELPIDLAATRDIKIRLAKEMTRIGQAELAQWYMKKLAAREGLSYMLSTDTLLDMACEDHFESSHSYPYIVTNMKQEEEEVFTQQTAPLFQIQDCDGSFWQVGQESMKYLSSSSGYVTEVVYDKKVGEYTKKAFSPTHRSEDQPSRTSICEDSEVYTYSTNSLRRVGSTRAYGMQRKPSKIQLHIDYTNSAEDDDDEENVEEARDCEQQRNVRFQMYDNANEFCNCPNCKKMGYAFSPDIRNTGRKFVQVGQQIMVNKTDGFCDEIVTYPTPQYYPATTTTNYGNYFSPEDYMEKPRKRKKKLFSGLKSMFKESIKVQRGNQEPVLDDAGILFAVSLRDRNKAKTIKERQTVRKSNSFSGKSTQYCNEDEVFDVFPHEHILKSTLLGSVPILNDSPAKHRPFHSSTNTITNYTVQCDPRFSYFPDIAYPDNRSYDTQSVISDARINDVMSKDPSSEVEFIL